MARSYRWRVWLGRQYPMVMALRRCCLAAARVYGSTTATLIGDDEGWHGKSAMIVTVACGISAMYLQLLEIRKHLSANGAVSEAVEARDVIVHVVRDVSVTVAVTDGVSLDEERAIGETWGDDWVDEAMP